MKKIVLASILLGLTGCSKVTVENYNKLEVGMDKTELEQILGSADNCEEKTLHTNCIWGSDDKHIKVTLLSDKVTLYSKKGIE
ncbi:MULTISPECIES: DUF3862 domain-containing protein [Pseudoalteromonas]|uniref:Lipoprotein n=1 Tax=Pseudoalteromonas peptidolytica F12-50-A1 TaxID=1315280 RepID=A0A8I0MV91_9GAMM|nr:MULTISPECIES: DUF3862 domain-containing protein [Pseudoalteromonas]MBE0346431.1 hypothetical protein [Pseudoalteromonas peptidolytica F12-50-A1]MDW7550569.1 DUF3862 domain-containing protein [Pseudoalteromonas peptidolytica]NLR14626.1 DUF3862 domain-containing protein [Pseudoalteromonas peptidolytica]RXF07012.1 DUF3862 domain-containing protein [Pseudoalteromonas sp. PS5]USD30006.1 DUF3862 domain-containing protein [Pseudoalteromonas sp. SCSIO 43201]